jgi:SnoaL-like domain
MSEPPPVTDVDRALRTAAGWAVLPDPLAVQQIQNLVQAYALYSDAGRSAELADLFTVDAVWDGRELGYGLAEGAGAIGPHVTSHFTPGQPMMHLPGPALLTAVAEDEVHGVSWCVATRWQGGSTIPLIHFYYADVIRRGDDGRWRFASRRLWPAFPRPS